MIELFSTLIGFDRKNILDLDFVEVFVELLRKINFDFELFLNLLVDSDSVKMLELFLKIYKTENIGKRFGRYLPEGEFLEWTHSIVEKIEKSQKHFPFNPTALLRIMKSV